MRNDDHKQPGQRRSQHGTVLVVDDDVSRLVTIAQTLRAEGYRVLVAASYTTLRVSARMRPDMIVLGVMPPLHEAIEIGILLRANPLTARVPIVAMSTPERLDAVATVMPIEGRLQIPFELSQLSALVARWMPAPVSPSDERVGRDATSGT